MCHQSSSVSRNVPRDIQHADQGSKNWVTEEANCNCTRKKEQKFYSNFFSYLPFIFLFTVEIQRRGEGKMCS